MRGKIFYARHYTMFPRTRATLATLVVGVVGVHGLLNSPRQQSAASTVHRFARTRLASGVPATMMLDGGSLLGLVEIPASPEAAVTAATSWATEHRNR